jgi:hypothetical protein
MKPLGHIVSLTSSRHTLGREAALHSMRAAVCRELRKAVSRIILLVLCRLCGLTRSHAHATHTHVRQRPQRAESTTFTSSAAGPTTFLLRRCDQWLTS